jgi:predicted RNase H-like HicB family nuclease
MHVTLTIDVERETDGRWLAEVPELPGDDTLVSLTFTRTTS